MPVSVRYVAGHGAGGPPPRRDRADAQLLDDVSAWLRGLVWALGPVAPTTRVASSTTGRATATPGGPVSMPVTVVNTQRTAVSVVLAPSPLRNDAGVAWFPEVVGRAAAVVPAGEERTIELTLAVPDDLPTGTYRGTLPLLAMTGGEPAIEVEVVGG